MRVEEIMFSIHAAGKGRRMYKAHFSDNGVIAICGRDITNYPTYIQFDPTVESHYNAVMRISYRYCKKCIDKLQYITPIDIRESYNTWTNQKIKEFMEDNANILDKIRKN